MFPAAMEMIVFHYNHGGEKNDKKKIALANLICSAVFSAVYLLFRIFVKKIKLVGTEF